MKNILVYAAVLAGLTGFASAESCTPISVENGVATIDGDCTQMVSVSGEQVVETVVYTRTGSAKNASQSIILPFAVDKTCDVKGADFYKASKVAANKDGKWQMSVDRLVRYDSKNNVTVLNNGLSANTPYVIYFRQDEKKIEISNCQITLVPANAVDQTIGNWTFRGVYESKEWAEGDRDLGFVYGFTSQAESVTWNEKDTTLNVGTFARAAAGSTIRPLRAYLLYAPPAAKASAGAIASIKNELPETIEVIFEENEHTTSVGHLNTLTGDIDVEDRWFDLNGRQLNKKPSIKGTYYNNGNKVVIK